MESGRLGHRPWSRLQKSRYFGPLLHTWTLRVTTFPLPLAFLVAKRGLRMKLSRSPAPLATPLAVEKRQSACANEAKVPVEVLHPVKLLKVLRILFLNSPRLRKRVTLLGTPTLPLLPTGTNRPLTELKLAAKTLQAPEHPPPGTRIIRNLPLKILAQIALPRVLQRIPPTPSSVP